MINLRAPLLALAGAFARMVPWSGISTARKATSAALFLIAATVLVLLARSFDQEFLLCDMECGETFGALHQARNYHITGLDFGLIEDFATSAGRDAHPFLYTHNVNIGSLLYVMLEAAGLESIAAKQVVTLAIFALGLWYVYRATAYVAGSTAIGVIMLAFFCSQYLQVSAWGLNALRAWHWLALFGMVFHVGRLARDSAPRLKSDYAAVALFAAVSFGIGYDYTAVVGVVALLVYALNAAHPLNQQRHRLGLGWIIGSFAFPFLLRQIQVAAALGTDFWWRDFQYSVLIKVPLAHKLFELPPMAEIEAYYAAFNVLRPPATPAQTVGAILGLAGDLMAFVTVPSFGLLTVVVGAVVGAACLVSAFVPTKLLGKVLTSTRARRALANLLALPQGGPRLCAALILGTGIGLAIFSPVSLHIYLKHEFPLVAAPILLAKSLFVFALLSVALRAGSRPLLVRAATVIAVTALVADHVVVNYENYRAKKPLALDWLDAVRERAGANFAVQWIPSVVSAVGGDWVVGLPPGSERRILERVAAGKPPFQVSDYMLFGERDRWAPMKDYSRPDYWLYFPTDQVTPFDSPSPPCRQDYLTRLISRGLGGQADIRDAITHVTPAVVRPDGSLLVYVRLPRAAPGTVTAFEVALGSNTVGSLPFNCQYRWGQYVMPVPDGLAAGAHDLRFRAVLRQGHRIDVGVVKVTVDSKAPSSGPTPSIRRAQLTAPEMLAANPGIPVSRSSANYVLFDLRNVYRDSGRASTPASASE